MMLSLTKPTPDDARRTTRRRDDERRRLSKESKFRVDSRSSSDKSKAWGVARGTRHRIAALSELQLESPRNKKNKVS